MGSGVVANWLSCSMACGILVSQPVIDPLSSVLPSRFLTTGRPGKSPTPYFLFAFSMSSFRPPEISFSLPPLHSLPKATVGTWEHNIQHKVLSLCLKWEKKWPPPFGIVNAAALFGLFLKLKIIPLITCCLWAQW